MKYKTLNFITLRKLMKAFVNKQELLFSKIVYHVHLAELAKLHNTTINFPMSPKILQ